MFLRERLGVWPWSVLLLVGLSTSLSLLGDTALYTVLPTHTAETGVLLVSVGILLSANRFVRLLANGALAAAGLVPPLAYALIPLWGVRGVYWLSAGLFGLMSLFALHWSVRQAALGRLPG
jgi:hypothetical protein